MSKLGHLVEEIEATLEQEKKNFEVYDPMFNEPDAYYCKGWIEALEYVLRQIGALH